MKARTLFLGVLVAALLPVGAARADAVHVVTPGESLYSVAAIDGLSVDSLAAANGLPIDAGLTVGEVLAIPPQGAAYNPTPSSAAPATADGAGVTYFSGETSSQPSVGAEPGGGFVSGAEIGDEAAAEGVPASLAEAIAWQESGFNNDEVSSTGAVGVMQLEPGTVSWINDNLSPSDPVDPDDPGDNVRGGVLLLSQLLAQSGGDEATAVADYYQGAASVAAYGMFPSTQQYVNDVLSLQDSFGG